MFFDFCKPNCDNNFITVISVNMKEYKIKSHTPDIVPPESMEEMRDEIVNMKMKRNKSGEIAKKERRKLDLRLAEFDERLSMLEIKINQIKEGVENANRRNKKY
jgi:hypothetical protein|tara:strand:- start:188 stop:499 length:312 start_codon:yes stop_codon:yes gene_type:complete